MEDYTTLPSSVEEARAEIEALQSKRKKARSVYWASIYFIGTVVFFIVALNQEDQRQFWAFLIAGICSVFFLLAAKGKITWRPSPTDRAQTREEETDRRIAFLEGYIRSQQTKKQ